VLEAVVVKERARGGVDVLRGQEVEKGGRAQGATRRKQLWIPSKTKQSVARDEPDSSCARALRSACAARMKDCSKVHFDLPKLLDDPANGSSEGASALVNVDKERAI